MKELRLGNFDANHARKMAIEFHNEHLDTVLRQIHAAAEVGLRSCHVYMETDIFDTYVAYELTKRGFEFENKPAIEIEISW